MDPCPFVRLVVGSLALKFSGNPPLPSTTYYCKIKLNNSPTQIADVPYCPDNTTQVSDQVQTCFSFKKSEFEKLSNGCLKIEVYSGRSGNPICGVGSGKLLGVVSVALDSDDNWVLQNGWVGLGDKKKSVQLHLNVWVEPDPRFVFEFEDEPECSPQVFQVNGNVRQAVFSCKFSFRDSNEAAKWTKDKVKPVKERKGWSITIHDLSGSPVAMASMVTPFVPSNGSDDVRRSNPGAWLILRPGHNTWKPWGRLEAWRESTNLGYRFEVLPDAGIEAITLSSSAISSKHGGKFTIDIGNGWGSPMTTPTGSFDSSGSEDIWMYQGGFVMSSKVGGRPEVEIGVQHVTCTEDAAAFVALAAAVDLSVDACQPFSRKLRKELRQ
ncbi:hypothetical protein HanHA300_Chr04g0158151 [Helianthus annuus]|nr:hypothetical protein HanHA300_Chr04g0158151 [Helianthus annuus]KAJ0591369.1 hypothetical protein HanIR_Chr04g0207611 [Helianthus annuus]KAJ0933553.1 hypothetical protein HanPSC8_Chr04g0186141 [Helianthus annuus]